MKKIVILFTALVLACALPVAGNADMIDKWDIALHANGRPLYAGQQGGISLVKERMVLALVPLNRDRVQTYAIAEQGTEGNPSLGQSPGRWAVEGYFALVHLGMYLLDNPRIPKWIPVLVYDSINYAEVLHGRRNDDVRRARELFSHTGELSFFPVDRVGFPYMYVIGYTWEW